MNCISTILKIVKMTKSLSDWTNKNVEILFSRPRVEKIYRNLGFLKVSGGYFRRKSGESGDPTIRRVGKFAPRPEAIVRNVIGLPSAHLAAGRRSPSGGDCPKSQRFALRPSRGWSALPVCPFVEMLESTAPDCSKGSVLSKIGTF